MAFSERGNAGMTEQDVLYWVWFSSVMGIGAETEPVLSLYVDPKALFEARDCEDFSNIMTEAQIARLKNTTPEQCYDILENCKKRNVKILPFFHPQYPDKLREILDAPAVLYCTGNAGLLSPSFAVAMVGSRRHSAYGMQAAAEITKGLAKAKVTIVSGLADGLDSVAHRTALEQGTPTIAVMGTGHHQCYPPKNAALRAAIEQNGAVISEVFPEGGANKCFFSLRNRIIAALSDSVCVVEARKRSGTMQTAAYAQKYARNLFSVPGSIFSPLSEGTNELLKKGALPCVSAQSILHPLGIDDEQLIVSQSTQQSKISQDAKKVMEVLTPIPKNLGVLAQETGLAIWQLSAALTELELCGKAVQMAGRQYLLA